MSFAMTGLLSKGSVRRAQRLLCFQVLAFQQGCYVGNLVLCLFPAVVTERSGLWSTAVQRRDQHVATSRAV